MGTLKAPPLSAPALITAEHDCSAFSCGEGTLTEWLQKRALANQAGGGSRTYVICAEGIRVVGYYALAPGAVARQVATGLVRRNMPTPVPIFVLGRLAVDGLWKGKGIGTGLLKDAMLRCVQAAEIVGGRALLCHAIDEDAKRFYLKHGFVASSLEPLTAMLSLDEIGKLL
jgi:GNAT superfamily N-acetyltransferase